MTRTGGDTVELGSLLRELTAQRRDIAAAVDRAADAVARFEARSTEHVPALPAHRASGDELEARLRALTADVTRCRDALAAADRWRGAWLVETGVELELERQGLVTLAEAARTWPRFRRDVQAGGAAVLLRRAELDRATRPWFDEQALGGFLGGLRDDVARARGQVSVVTREVTDATGRVGRARAALANTRVAAVARIGSRGLGAAGTVATAVGTVRSWQEGDTEAAVVGAASTLSSAAMLSGVPALQLAGAAVQAGLLVYEHREAIAGAASAMGSAMRSAVDGLF